MGLLLALTIPQSNSFAAGRAQASRFTHFGGSASAFGLPLSGIASSPVDLTNFTNGMLNFQEVETLNPADATSGPPGQLGPLFNNTSCAGCHSNPARGGGGLALMEQRLSTGGPPVRIFAVDNMMFGGPLAQGALGQIFTYGQIAPPLGAEIGIPGNVPSACQEVEIARGFSPELPTCIAESANDSGLTGTPTCVAHRQSLPLFGDGLVEATADATFEAIAAAQPSAIQGTVRMVTDLNNFDGPAAEVSQATLSALGTPHVGRFGWKDDFATLVGFSADAYLNEIGITNDLNSQPNTTCAMGVQQYGVTLQTADDPEDTVDATGRADIDRFTDFMRGLQPPPPLPQSAAAQTGQKLFEQIGCNGCHTEAITTAPDPASFLPPTINGTPISTTVNKALANVTYHPYSDFLLHDMGSLGDGVNDDPGITHDERLMRTMPLWGIRMREVFLHDGRATDLPTAIALHDGQGRAAAAAFQALSAEQQQEIVDFLKTL
ncbi:MAG TPA: di-heme oxidoredictase family protein [Candidatus Binataceae bacterium]|nr:di-heme oxidoredictase family protein [Candidatus Binataceae bacterium]